MRNKISTRVFTYITRVDEITYMFTLQMKSLFDFMFKTAHMNLYSL